MTVAPTSGLPFLKMHGLGNDFVVIDRRDTPWALSARLVAALADRHRGIGFDQLAALDPAEDAAGKLTFYNADGSLSAACGNATRCIARFLFEQSGGAALDLLSDYGRLRAEDVGDGLTRVNMGPPQLGWREIPLAEEADTLHLPIEGDPVATGMGNPHCTFFVEDAEEVDLATFGPRHEHHPLYPERTNVQVVHLAGPDRLRMRVWERGVGITLASGSSSCAVAVAAARRGLTGRSVEIDLDGGTIAVDWRADGVWMTGTTMLVAQGVLSPQFLEAHA